MILQLVLLLRITVNYIDSLSVYHNNVNQVNRGRRFLPWDLVLVFKGDDSVLWLYANELDAAMSAYV